MVFEKFLCRGRNDKAHLLTQKNFKWIILTVTFVWVELQIFQIWKCIENFGANNFEFFSNIPFFRDFRRLRLSCKFSSFCTFLNTPGSYLPTNFHPKSMFANSVCQKELRTKFSKFYCGSSRLESVLLHFWSRTLQFVLCHCSLQSNFWCLDDQTSWF